MNALSFVAVASLLIMSPGPNGVLIAKTVPMSGKIAGFANIAGFVAALHFHAMLSILGISAIFLASANAFFVFKMLGAAYLCWIGIKALRDAIYCNNRTQSIENTEQTKNIEPALLDPSQTNGWPIHMVKEMNIYLKAERCLQQKGIIEPTAADIAAECKKPVANVKRMLVLRERVLSDSLAIDPDGGRPLAGLIPDDSYPKAASTLSAFLEGFLTNMLNPKTSMFYLAAFPQFITIGDRTATSAYILVLLATLINVSWFGTMVILFARLARFTRRGSVQRWLNGVTGIVFIGFGAKLAAYRVQ